MAKIIKFPNKYNRLLRFFKKNSPKLLSRMRDFSYAMLTLCFILFVLLLIYSINRGL